MVQAWRGRRPSLPAATVVAGAHVRALYARMGGSNTYTPGVDQRFFAFPMCVHNLGKLFPQVQGAGGSQS